MLTLNLKRGTLPQGDDRMLLSSFASQAAVAINNARLFAEAEARRRAAETHRDLGRALSQALDVNIVARLVADGVCALLGGQESGLFLIEAESGDLVSLALSGDIGPAAGPSLTLPAGTGASALAIRERCPVTTTDILTDPRITLLADLRAHIEGSPHRSVMSVPLVVKDVVIGALAVADRAGRIFEAEDIRIAQAFADQAALALDNARLYEEAHQRVRHLDSLRDVVEQILVPISLEERLTVIAGKAAELFGADRATIALRDGERDALVIRAGHGLAEGEVGRELRPDAGALSLAAATRAGALVNDYQAWPQRDPYVIADVRGAARLGRDRLPVDDPRPAHRRHLGRPPHGRSSGSYAPTSTASRAWPSPLRSPSSTAASTKSSRSACASSRRLRRSSCRRGKLSAVGQLVSGVAHELNNPLSVILGYAQLLAARDLPAELRRPVEMMLAQGARMAKIVQSLLLFSRQRKAERGAVDVREAIEQPLSLRATQLMLSGVRVSATYGEGVPAAEGDAHQLQQVFLNLILNAEQAILGSRVGGRRVGDAIRVTTGRARGPRPDLGCDHRGRQWPGHSARRPAADLRAVLHHEEGGRGDRPRLERVVRNHPAARRAHERGEPPRPHRVHHRAARRHVAAAVAGRGARGGGRHGRGPRTACAGRGRRAGRPRSGRRALAPGRLGGGDGDGGAGRPRAIARRELRPRAGRHAHARRRAARTCTAPSRRERGELTERFLFMTGDTANPEAWRFIEATHASVIEKPFTAQALLSAVERVAA